MPGASELTKKLIATSSDDYPTFVLGGKRYDEGSFTGRLCNILIQYDFRKCFESDDSLTAAENLVATYKKTAVAERGSVSSNEKLWAAQELLGGRCHPDTGERIPVLFTFAAFVPSQPPIILGMIWPGAGAAHQAFFQIVNQLYNAGVNFSNKNMSVAVSNEELMMSTVGSVVTGCGLGVGMVKLGEKMGHPAVRGSAAFVGSVGAGCASLILMRRNEMEHGVDIFDEDGNKRGRSTVAAGEGIAKCCAARVIWNVPCTGVVPVAYSYYAATKLAKAKPMLNIPVHIGLVVMGISAGLFPGQALFTQTAAIDASKLEPELRCLSRLRPEDSAEAASWTPGVVKTFTYNKGM